METRILSGKKVSSSFYTSIKPRIDSLKSSDIIPGLAVLLVGDNAASALYVRNKTKKFNELRLYSETITFSDSVSQDEIISKIQELNLNQSFHGILVQLPLPDQINDDIIINSIDPKKDVDGFHPYNLGCLISGKSGFVPCTPKGIMRILDYYDIDLSNKHVVVIGRSNIVGKPLAILMLQKTLDANATVTVCHTGTPDLASRTKEADILVAAIGKPKVITADMVKEGAIVVDVGINRVDDASKRR